MVNDKLLVRDKHRKKKKFSKWFLIIMGIIAILAIAYFLGFFSNKGEQITIENPLKNIVFANTNQAGEIDGEAVIQQGIEQFNENYIIYLLVSLGTNNLHKSYTGYGPAKINLIIDDETWSAQIEKGLSVQKSSVDDPDLIIKMSKQTAVESLLSPNIQSHLKSSVNSGQVSLELVAGKVELASKGYLKMYTQLTGEEISVE